MFSNVKYLYVKRGHYANSVYFGIISKLIFHSKVINFRQKSHVCLFTEFSRIVCQDSELVRSLLKMDTSIIRQVVKITITIHKKNIKMFLKYNAYY